MVELIIMLCVLCFIKWGKERSKQSIGTRIIYDSIFYKSQDTSEKLLCTILKNYSNQ